MKTYYTGLDILRFIAALGVVNFHYFFGLAPIGLTSELTLFRYGNLGVPLFFIISGFVISQSVANNSTKNFALGRFIRLYPMFWFACTFTYIFTLIMPNGQPVQFPEYLISMTMLGDKLSTALGYGGLVDAVYWTLAVELLFYVYIGLFVYLFSWKNIRYFLWGWLILSATSYLFHLDQNFGMKMLLVRHASFFIMGGALALYLENGFKLTREKFGDLLLVVLSVAYTIYISPRAIPAYFVPNSLDTTIVAYSNIILVLLVLFFIYISKYLKNPRTRVICAVIGGLTYPIYLLHQTVGRTAITYITEKFDYSWTSIGIVIEVIMLILAYGAYKYDKQLRVWLKAKLQTKEETS